MSILKYIAQNRNKNKSIEELYLEFYDIDIQPLCQCGQKLISNKF